MISPAQHRAIESEGALTPAQAVIGERLFADLPTEELRAMACKTCDRANWKDWDRPMLLAFHQNRHGKYVPQVSA